MKAYFGYKLISTMTDIVFVLLADSEGKVHTAVSLYKDALADGEEETMECFNQYIEAERIICIDDANSEMTIGKVDNETECVIDSYGSAYIYRLCGTYKDRF